MSLKVLYIAAECKPFSKSGGVGDVAGELPVALADQGVAIEVVTPGYGRGFDARVADTFALRYLMRRETVGIVAERLGAVPVTLLTNRTYFGTDYTVERPPQTPSVMPHAFRGDYTRPYVDSPRLPFYDDALRFAFFSEACLEIIARKQPDVVHVNDWPMGFLLARMVMKAMPQRRVLTIHNVGYQGNMGRSSIVGLDIERIAEDPVVGLPFVDPRPAWFSVNPLRLGMELAHEVNTVSPTYKVEMTQPENPTRYFEGGKGLDAIASRIDREGRLHGILNGFQYSFEPTHERFEEMLAKKAEAKQALASAFANPAATLIGFVGRAVEQKFRLLAETVNGTSVLDQILAIPNVNVAIVATGLPEYEAFLRRFQGRPNFAATLAFDRIRAAQISLGSDLFLMPSLFEPCGIAQMESMSCATPPIVRLTGGLVDTVVPHARAESTGFGFDGPTPFEVLANLLRTTREAVEVQTQNPAAFRTVQWRGFQQRFRWSSAAASYIEKLYTHRTPVPATAAAR